MSVRYDAVAPVAIDVADHTANLTTNTPITFSVVFSEALLGTVATTNFTATNGTVSSVTKVDSTHYNVVVTPVSNLTTGTVGLSLVGTGLTDAAGNAVADTSLTNFDTQEIHNPGVPSFENTTTRNVDCSTQMVTGTADAGSFVTIYDTNGAYLGSTQALGDGSFSVELILTNGSHDLTATATDSDGNVSVPSGVLNYVVNASLPNAPTLAVNAYDANSASQTVTGTADVGSLVSIYDTDGSLLVSDTADDGTFSITTSLANGSHALYATVTDGSGNVSLVSNRVDYVIHARLDPTINIIRQTSNNVDPSVAKAGDTITVEYTCTAASNTVTIGGNATAINVINDPDNPNKFLATYKVVGGDVMNSDVVVTAIDDSLNIITASKTGSVRIDTFAPSAPTLADNAINGRAYVKSTTQTITGSAEIGSLVKIYGTDGTTVLGTGTATDGTFSIVVSNLTSGAHTLTATATDIAGNTSVMSSGLYFKIDAVPPSISTITEYSNNTNNSIAKVGDIITASFTSTDPVTAATIGGHDVLGSLKQTASGYTVNYQVQAGDSTNANVSITSTDIAGNSTTQSLTGAVTIDISGTSSVATSGNDVFVGGAGADTLQYTSWSQLYSDTTDHTDTFANFHAGQGDRVDLSTILGAGDKLTSIISIDGSGEAASNSILNIEHGGSSWAVVVAAGQEVGIPDLMWNSASGVSSSTALNGASWTDVVDVTGASSSHSGPRGVSAAPGASIANSAIDAGGDWTIQIKSGTATMDAANRQITFSSAHTGNEVVITDHLGNMHDISNVDKITWHG